jgi:hypothetical protein
MRSVARTRTLGAFVIANSLGLHLNSRMIAFSIEVTEVVGPEGGSADVVGVSAAETRTVANAFVFDYPLTMKALQMRRVRVKDPPTLVLIARNGTNTVVDDVRELFLRFPDGRELELDLAPHPRFSKTESPSRRRAPGRVSPSLRGGTRMPYKRLSWEPTRSGFRC